MIAGGADFGGLGAHHDVAAVAALPHFYFALGKHFCHFNVVQQGAVALFVMLFNGSHQAEPGSQFGEALFLSRLGKAVIHIGPFVIFARGGGFQVVGGIADAVQLLEPQLGMFFFVISRFQKQCCDLLKTLLLGHGGKEGVLVACFGFARKCGHQVFLALGTSILVHNILLINSLRFIPNQSFASVYYALFYSLIIAQF